MSVLIATRGPKEGKCNICGEEGKLTEDHTPPKGCIKIKQVELHYIIQHLQVKYPQSKGRISQNGVKYRTLCDRCNNSLLGTKYDPEFILFVNSIGDYLKTHITIPPIVYVKTKPQKVMRSLLGHLCAQGVDRYEKNDFTESLREYFLKPEKPLPGEIKIYYWPFPYENHVMAKDCALIDLRVMEPVSVWFLKFFPIAFLVTFNEPKGYDFNLANLSQWKGKDIDFEAEAPVFLNRIPHQFWPEAPSKHTMVLYGQEAIVSVDQKKLKS